MEYSIYQSAHYGAFDKIQILTIEGLLSGTESPHYPDLRAAAPASGRRR